MTRLRAAWACLRGKSVIHRCQFQFGPGQVNFPGSCLPTIFDTTFEAPDSHLRVVAPPVEVAE